MAARNLTLVVDLQNQVLVSLNGSVTQMPDLFQSNTVSLRVQGVNPTGILFAPGNPNGAYTVVDLAGFGLRASVGQQPTGSSGGPSPLALQDTFNWDATNKWFYADLALNTTDVDNYIGSLPLKQAWFELNLTNAGNRTTILQVNFNIKAVVDELTSTVPTPTNQYLTKAEILALLASKLDRLIKSPSGTYGRELGVADDGTPTDSIDKLT